VHLPPFLLDRTSGWHKLRVPSKEPTRGYRLPSLSLGIVSGIELPFNLVRDETEFVLNHKVPRAPGWARWENGAALVATAATYDIGLNKETETHFRRNGRVVLRRRNNMKSARSFFVDSRAKAPTGIVGFAEITGGGWPRGRTTLPRGDQARVRQFLRCNSQCMAHGIVRSRASLSPLRKRRISRRLAD
jgi:hypothetical protein